MKKITILDGAVGTELWKAAEAAGLAKAPVWTYNLTAPQLVTELHKKYIEAGSEIICTNTFSANIPVVEKEGFNWEEVIETAVSLAKKAAEGRCRTALDLGPLFTALEPFGNTTEVECRDIYRRLCEKGAKAGADLIFLETFMDSDMLEYAAEEAKKTGLELFCSMSFEKTGKTLYGASPASMMEALSDAAPDAVGLNCSFGPADAVSVMKAFREITDLPLILKPNTADMDAQSFADAMDLSAGIVDYIGACCGSDPEYITELKQRFA